MIVMNMLIQPQGFHRIQSVLGSGLGAVSKPEHDSCGASDCGEADLRAPVVSRGDVSPVFQASEHDLDLVAAFVAALVVHNGLAAQLPAWDAWLYPLVFQRISEPVGIIARVRQQPFCLWQTTQQGCCTRAVADLPCGYSVVMRKRI